MVSACAFYRYLPQHKQKTAHSVSRTPSTTTRQKSGVGSSNERKPAPQADLREEFKLRLKFDLSAEETALRAVTFAKVVPRYGSRGFIQRNAHFVGRPWRRDLASSQAFVPSSEELALRAKTFARGGNHCPQTQANLLSASADIKLWEQDGNDSNRGTNREGGISLLSRSRCLGARNL